MISSASISSSARGSLRVLLRAVHETFAGDAKALVASRAEIRKHYRANADVVDAAKISQLIASAHDAAAFLKESIVQARLTKEGRYGEGKREERFDFFRGKERIDWIRVNVLVGGKRCTLRHVDLLTLSPSPSPPPRPPAAMKVGGGPGPATTKTVEVTDAAAASASANKADSGGGGCSKPACGCA